MLDEEIDYLKEGVKKYVVVLNNIREELAKSIVGQREIVTALLRALLAGGNVLVEGVPGIAKTVMIKSLASILGCKYSRIQFTVDLLSLIHI